MRRLPGRPESELVESSSANHETSGGCPLLPGTGQRGSATVKYTPRALLQSAPLQHHRPSIYFDTEDAFARLRARMDNSLVHPNILSLLPFVALLAAIAVAPLVFAGWWRKFYPLVCGTLGAGGRFHYVFGLGATANVLGLG